MSAPPMDLETVVPRVRAVFHRPAPPRPTQAPAAGTGRLVIVSNRLPVCVRVNADGVRLSPSAGGLATGLRGVHERSGGLWMGWPGTDGHEPPATRRAIRDRLAAQGAVPVFLSADEIARFYECVANGVLWPALHEREPEPATADDWTAYRTVNARFADALAARLCPGDQVWVHDYHLMLLPRMLRARRPDAQIGFFLHTPFPPAATLAALPQAAELLDGLLGADVVGLHTAAYVSRFTEAVETVLGRAQRGGAVVDGGRRVRVRACAMSVDGAAFAERASDPAVDSMVERLRGDGGPLLVGIDRLDYTKGIPERLAAFERLLERRPELRGRARLFQLAVPSRESVPAYRALRARVEEMVARINGWYRTARWTPIEYVHGTVDDQRLAALYRAADVMLVTPLRDGMNLVAKEFVASRTDDDGVLVLSRGAGAAAELRTALLVDPSDVGGLSAAIETAIAMPRAERRVRMRWLRRRVRHHDVFDWARECLIALGSSHSAVVGRPAGA